MHITKVVPIAALIVGAVALVAQPTETISSGSSIVVRTNEGISVRNAVDGRVYSGVVEQDVLDSRGRVAIPRGSNAELMVRDLGQRSMSLDLDSVTVDGRRYSVSTSDITRTGGNRDGVGKNERTAKYVGGGAILGTIIGAIAGGGKGAAIGALAGGAAGAGGQVLTRGNSVRVPAESVVTFRLERSLTVTGPDRGYERDGHHYHYQDRQ